MNKYLCKPWFAAILTVILIGFDKDAGGGIFKRERSLCDLERGI